MAASFLSPPSCRSGGGAAKAGDIDQWLGIVRVVAGAAAAQMSIDRRLACRSQHNGVPPDFNRVLLDEPRRWFDAVATLLLWELNHRDPQLFDTLHTHG